MDDLPDGEIVNESGFDNDVTESESDSSESESGFRFNESQDSEIEIESYLENEFDYRLGFHAVRLCSDSLFFFLQFCVVD